MTPEERAIISGVGTGIWESLPLYIPSITMYAHLERRGHHLASMGHLLEKALGAVCSGCLVDLQCWYAYYFYTPMKLQGE
ncbi:hypothetical protein H0H92_014797 [Tricholoma furcatifolium]|nr:hypothetical protein H0H92_014797 [Tricholoma furcatifolium]